MSWSCVTLLFATCCNSCVHEVQKCHTKLYPTGEKLWVLRVSCNPFWSPTQIVFVQNENGRFSFFFRNVVLQPIFYVLTCFNNSFGYLFDVHDFVAHFFKRRLTRYRKSWFRCRETWIQNVLQPGLKLWAERNCFNNNSENRNVHVKLVSFFK